MRYLMMIGIMLCGAAGAVPEIFTIKKSPCNVRSGPGTIYPVQWVIVKSGYPLVKKGLSHDWVRVGDVNGVLGWIHKPMLSKKEGSLFIKATPLREKRDMTSSPIAYVKEGVMAVRVKSCDETWCRLTVESHDKLIEGFAPTSHLWPQHIQAACKVVHVHRL